MRHRKAFRKFSRTPSHRKAMFANMVMALVESGRIQTTDAKAKELRRVAEKMVTLAKRGVADSEGEGGKARLLAAKRLAFAKLRYPGKQVKKRGHVPVLASTPKVDGEGGARRLNPDTQFRAEKVVDALFGDIAERFKDRPGGYTRIIKIGNRLGDNAAMSYLEFVDFDPAVRAAAEEEAED